MFYETKFFFSACFLTTCFYVIIFFFGKTEKFWALSKIFECTWRNKFAIMRKRLMRSILGVGKIPGMNEKLKFLINRKSLNHPITFKYYDPLKYFQLSLYSKVRSIFLKSPNFLKASHFSLFWIILPIHVILSILVSFSVLHMQV